MVHALRMRWIDLAFLHWRIPAEMLRALIPAPLELDVFEGSAWLGVTPFRMTGVRPVFTPPIPTANDFPELNVRTYVQYGGRAGVWFFSLDAASWVAVVTARSAVGLPYFHARMDQRRAGEVVDYDSFRTHSKAPPAAFRGRYRPTGPVYRAEAGSLDYWLTERYSLFSRNAGKLLRLDIEHVQWPLQPATADIELNTMASAAGIMLPSDSPHVRFTGELDVVAHWPTMV
ncbi:MAG: YqjF family protein [Gemmatimonadaceae bacterium]